MSLFNKEKGLFYRPDGSNSYSKTESDMLFTEASIGEVSAFPYYASDDRQVPTPFVEFLVRGKSQQSTGTPSLAAPLALSSTFNTSITASDFELLLPQILRGVYSGSIRSYGDSIRLDGIAKKVLYVSEVEELTLTPEVGTWKPVTGLYATFGDGAATPYIFEFTEEYGNHGSWTTSSSTYNRLLCTHLPFSTTFFTLSNAAAAVYISRSDKNLWVKIPANTVVNGETIDSLAKWIEAVAFINASDNPLKVIVPRTKPITIDISATPIGKYLLASNHNPMSFYSISNEGVAPAFSFKYKRDTARMVQQATTDILALNEFKAKSEPVITNINSRLGSGVVYGFEATASGTASEITISPGELYLPSGEKIVVEESFTTTIEKDEMSPKAYLICVTASGDLGKPSNTGSTTVPDLPAGAIPLCTVVFTTGYDGSFGGDGILYPMQSDITDIRPMAGTLVFRGAWIPATLINGWVGTLEYRHEFPGTVRLRGSIGVGTGTGITTVVENLRPSQQCHLPVISSDNIMAGLIISSTGVVSAFTSIGTPPVSINFDSIIYLL